jgi:hypothetical protein
VTQQSSALVEDNAAWSKTLEHPSESMNRKVAFFKRDQRAESAPSSQWPHGQALQTATIAAAIN